MKQRRRARLRSFRILLVALLWGAIAVDVWPEPSVGQTEQEFWLDLELVADGLVQPVYVTQPADGSDRLFVVEKAGVIRIIEHGVTVPDPFLDITANVQSSGSEQGLLGLAFHPNYAVNGNFYITYSPTVTEWRLERYQVSADAMRADPASAMPILTVEHPGATHYAGNVLFGPDGYLWVSLGDGGAGAYDPLGSSQDPTSLLGKLLRLDVDQSLPYTIPPDNPFVDVAGHRPEIWAYGLRNPWRFSFDRETDELFIGDVGEISWEEINYEPAGFTGGRNYGWPELEGSQCSAVAPDCEPSSFIPPIIEYDRAQGCAVTGGYVYRERADSPIYGHYIFADFCNGSIWTALPTADGVLDARVHLFTTITTMQISSFGQGIAGALYVVDFSDGAVFRLRASTELPTPVLQYIEPATIPAGGMACTVHLRGWNFQPEAVVTIQGDPRSTTHINNSWLTVELIPDDLAQAGSFGIAVAQTPALRSVELPVLMEGRIGARALYTRWAYTDEPVQSGAATRTWMWGPTGFTCATMEPYLDAQGGTRVVQYFDKSRMEVTYPEGDPNASWYVTNGLLATELITGQLQLGDDAFEQRAPSQTGVAGDLDDSTGPTYGTFSALVAPTANRSGALVVEHLSRQGEIVSKPELAEQATNLVYFDDLTGHNIPEPFWTFMNSSGPVVVDGGLSEGPLFSNPFFATGRPITEAYWATVKLAGEPALVLVQCFERRCLTYNPSNQDGWRVEAGNVGRHYYAWRHGR